MYYSDIVTTLVATTFPFLHVNKYKCQPTDWITVLKQHTFKCRAINVISRSRCIFVKGFSIIFFLISLKDKTCLKHKGQHVYDASAKLKNISITKVLTKLISCIRLFLPFYLINILV